MPVLFTLREPTIYRKDSPLNSMSKQRFTRLLRNGEHGIFEVWCEWAAESVYFSGRPIKEELEEVVLLNWKEAFEAFREQEAGDLWAFIKKYVVVEPLRRVYASV